MSDHDLSALLTLIKGQGPRWMGRGVTTYPGADDNHQALYQACRELECRGLIRRVWQRNTRENAIVYFE